MDGLGHMYRELLGRSPLAKVIAGLFGLIVGGGITVRLWIGGGGVRFVWGLPIVCALGGLILLVDGLTSKPTETRGTRERKSEHDRKILSRLLQAKKEGQSVLRALHELGIEDPVHRKRYFQMLEWMLKDERESRTDGNSGNGR